MSSEWESEQLHSMDSGSEGEQSAVSEAEEVDSNIEMDEEEGERENSEEADSEEEEEEKDDDSEEEGGEERNSEDLEEDEQDYDLSKKRSTVSKRKEKTSSGKSKNLLKNDSLEKHKKSKGKSLLVHFPYELTTDNVALETYVKKLSSRITKVRRPRKGDTFSCWVDFDSTEDRIKGFKELKGIEIDGHELRIDLPKTEWEKFLQEISERKTKLKEERKLNKLATKQNTEKEDVLTSTLSVTNIPLESTISDVKELFPEAVDIQINSAKGLQETLIATVTLPSPAHAMKACRITYEIGNNRLKVSHAKKNKQFITKTVEIHGLFAYCSPTPKKGKQRREEYNNKSPFPKKMKQCREKQTQIVEDGVKNISERKIIKIVKNNNTNKTKRVEIPIRPKQKQFMPFYDRRFFHNRPLGMPYAAYGARGIFNSGQIKNWKHFNNERQFNDGSQFMYKNQFSSVRQFENKRQFYNQMQFEGQLENEKRFKKGNQFQTGHPTNPFNPGHPKINSSVQFNNERQIMYKKHLNNGNQLENEGQMQIENEKQFDNQNQLKKGNEFKGEVIRKARKTKVK